MSLMSSKHWLVGWFAAAACAAAACNGRAVETGVEPYSDDGAAEDRIFDGGVAYDIGIAHDAGDDRQPDLDAGILNDVFDAGVWDDRPETGTDVVPDVFVRDMCTGSRPDGGLMDVTPSCGKSPTGKGGDVCRVPGGSFWMGEDTARPAQGGSNDPMHNVNVPTFFVDRQEVTVREYTECVFDGVCPPPLCKCAGGSPSGSAGCEVQTPNSDLPGHEEHPVNCVDWYQASTYCWWAGKRLPSEAEREKAARGTDLRTFPWGNEPPDLDKAVQSEHACDYPDYFVETAPVGSKPAGASPYGIMDLAGNVAEWVLDEFRNSYYHAPADGRSFVSNRAILSPYPSYVWRDYVWCPPPFETFNIRSDFRHYNHGGDAAPWLGFRCAVSVEDSEHQHDLAALDVGRSDGRRLGLAGIPDRSRPVPNPTEQDGGSAVQCAPTPTGRGGEMCDVPEGRFPMGCREIMPAPNNYRDCNQDPDEIPVHDVWLSAFKIDRFEVTAGEYRACVEAGGCTLPGNVNFVCNERCTYAVDGWENHPINCVQWGQARDYCTWAGKRLPTEAEWEKTAGGPEGLFWPWGNDLGIWYTNRVCRYAVLCPPEYGPWHVEPVGMKPLGVSPYGALDMIGNVWEWTNDWYDENYYANSPTTDPPGPPGGSAHVLRGGSPNYPFSEVDNKTRLAVFHPAYWSEMVGFRCAY